MGKRICLVTGGSSGAGFACALGLARLGAWVLLARQAAKSFFSAIMLRFFVYLSGNGYAHSRA